MSFEDAPASENASSLFTRDWSVPWHAHLMPAAIATLIVGIWIGSDGKMTSWAVSWNSLSEQSIWPLFMHMFAHGGLPHVAMNAVVLLLLSGPLISRLGEPPISWMRYAYLLVGSGLFGAAVFLTLNYGSSVSMLGASGAIFGLLGTLARIHPSTGRAVPINSRRTWLVVKLFIQNHVALFALLALIALLTGGAALVAWEAHLGGLLFGFFAAPLFLQHAGWEASSETARNERQR
jgi:membrane associated rhomboid family serine protease